MSATIGSEVAYAASPDGAPDQNYVNPAPPGGGRGGGGGFSRGGGGGSFGGRGIDRRPGGRGGSGSNGGGGSGGSHREGDWVCPNASCGNVNFARRVECNKCCTPKHPGSQSSSYNSGHASAGNYGPSGGYGGGASHGGQTGAGSGGYSGANNNGNRGGAGGYPATNDFDQNSSGSGYGSAAAHGGNEGQTVSGGRYGGNTYGGEGPGRGFGERPNFGGQPANSYSDTRGCPGSGGPRFSDSHVSDQGVGNMVPRVDYGRDNMRPGSVYGGVDTPSVKQCDENCGDSCDNSRIYISGLPLDVTSDELRELFGGIGQVARIKQKRGYKDQWPWNIKVYRDEAGKNKGDAVLSYEDPSAAHSAGGFFNDYHMRGHKIKVTMAEKYAPRSGGERSGGFGDRGYSGGGGPDRRGGGGYRSRPY